MFLEKNLRPLSKRKKEHLQEKKLSFSQAAKRPWWINVGIGPSFMVPSSVLPNIGNEGETFVKVGTIPSISHEGLLI